MVILEEQEEGWLEGLLEKELAAESDGDGKSQISTAASAGSRGRGHGRGRNAAAKRRGRAEGAAGKRKSCRTTLGLEKPEPGTKKKCKGPCKKTHDISCFNADQSSCKGCFNGHRKFDRLVKAQGEEAWWDALQAQNPKEAERTLRAFMKFNATALPRQKFNILEHKRRLKKSSGHRTAGRKKWMWEGEFVEEMQKTCHGNLTQEEAKNRWKELLADKNNTRDLGGPRGTTRMKIKVGDYESSFSELADEEEYEAAETPKKKAKEEDFKAAGQNLLSRGSSSLFLEDGEDSDAGGELQAAMDSFTGSIMTSSSGVDVLGFQKKMIFPNAQEEKARRVDFLERSWRRERCT